jgi:hypothetical protein
MTIATINEPTHTGYYAEVNLTLAYDRDKRYVTETRVDRTGWPDRGEWFDTLEEAEAFMRSEFADMAAELEDGYRITRVDGRLDSIEYVVGTVERDELDEDGNPIENGQILIEKDSRPYYVTVAMDKASRYEDLADRIAQERGEGWKVCTEYDDDHYYTSQEQVDAVIYDCGYNVIRTEDETEVFATIHVTYCE